MEDLNHYIKRNMNIKEAMIDLIKEKMRHNKKIVILKNPPSELDPLALPNIVEYKTFEDPNDSSIKNLRMEFETSRDATVASLLLKYELKKDIYTIDDQKLMKMLKLIQKDINDEIHVTNISPHINKEQVGDLFSQAGNIKKMEYCMKPNTDLEEILYVNIKFDDFLSVEDAIEMFNYTKWRGSVLKIQKKEIPKKRDTRLMLQNLDQSVTERDVFLLFKKYGDIEHIHLVKNEEDKCKGFGFVVFNDIESIQKALKEDGQKFKGKRLTLRISKNKQEEQKQKSKFFESRVNLFNISPLAGVSDIKNLFRKFGNILDVFLQKDQEGRNKGFGYVQFDSPEAAKLAIEFYDGKQFLGREIGVKLNEMLEEINDEARVFVNWIQRIDRKDVSEELKKFGKIVKEIPLKPTCGIFEFSSKEEAAAAIEFYNSAIRFHQTIWVRQAETKTFICQIDLQKYPIKNPKNRQIKLPCKHDLCLDCFRQYFEGKIKEAKVEDKDLICPVCAKEVSLELIRKNIKSDIYSKINYFRNKLKEESKILENSEEDVDEEFLQYMVKHNIKKCPFCSSLVERIDGCNKMTCKSLQCKGKKHFFCYLCGEKIMGYAHFGKYGPFGERCNKLDNKEDPNEPLMDDDEYLRRLLMNWGDD